MPSLYPLIPVAVVLAALIVAVVLIRRGARKRLSRARFDVTGGAGGSLGRPGADKH